MTEGSRCSAVVDVFSVKRFVYTLQPGVLHLKVLSRWAEGVRMINSCLPRFLWQRSLGRQTLPFSRAIVRVAKPRPMCSVGRSKRVQNNLCFAPPPPSYFVSKSVLNKGAINKVGLDTPGFYPQLFTQKNGEWRPILNLKPFNSVVVPSIKIEIVVKAWLFPP